MHVRGGTNQFFQKSLNECQKNFRIYAGTKSVAVGLRFMSFDSFLVYIRLLFRLFLLSFIDIKDVFVR